MAGTATRRKKSRPRVRALRDKERLEQLRAFVALCFIRLDEQCGGDPREIANVTGLSLATIYLRARPANVSLKMHAGTLQLLAAGAGLELRLVRGQEVVRVVR